MEAGNYIDELIKIRQAHGADLQVMRRGLEGAVQKAGLPKLAYMQKGATRTLFREGETPDRLRGDKVVLL